VRFESVSYRYTAEGPLVLHDVSLEIAAGRTTAIVGPSGAGKSTLADLLIGLLRPQSGSIAIDGQPLVEQNVGAWRRSIGYVPQDSFLLHDTIRANLAWARPDASETQMWDALNRASAGEFVRARPAALDAVVGDRGVRLSGGERQRLALARALLTEPTVLVLDEATSALDSLNERQILEAVHGLKGHMTVVIITHRLSSILDADAIYVVERGRCVETGTWAELSARDGVFSRLKAAQLGGAARANQAEAEVAVADATSGRATAIQGQ
jgi:ATP-binding cassette subfamily C protein